MTPAALIIAAAGSAQDPLVELQKLKQAQYLRSYLADLNAQSLLIEPQYFDRDYLSEFASFYCTSSAGYPNVCQRIHYFSSAIERSLLERACGGDEKAAQDLQDAYLGFVVRRPVPGTPFGRTVVKWYDDKNDQLPRVVAPSRWYDCHVAGLTLRVKGLAWQQQDVGVGACATVALWSMLHSSAFDGRHVVPTTADVTKTAHSAGLSYQRLFPSVGLTFGQLVATLRDSGFAPLVVPGDMAGAGPPSATSRFSREHFCSALASLVRSGLSVLLGGDLVDASGKSLGRHAVCAAGFRQVGSNPPDPGKLEFEDECTEYVYLHDDNLGPAVRFHVETDPAEKFLVLRAERPPKKHSLSLPDPTADYPIFVPDTMLAAAHDDVRVSPDHLHQLALELGTMLIAATGKTIGLSVGSRVLRVATYVGRELGTVLAGQPEALANARLALWEQVSPMSLHVAVVRFSIGGSPVLDVLYDTTDSRPNIRAFCHVAYHEEVRVLVAFLAQLGVVSSGVSVQGY